VQIQLLTAGQVKFQDFYLLSFSSGRRAKKADRDRSQGDRTKREGKKWSNRGLESLTRCTRGILIPFDAPSFITAQHYTFDRGHLKKPYPPTHGVGTVKKRRFWVWVQSTPASRRGPVLYSTPTHAVSLIIRIHDHGVTKRCRLSWLTNSALVYEPKCGVSARSTAGEHGAQINSIFKF
jgi:hypothetical protein